MKRYLVRLRDRNQITLPVEVVRRLKLEPDALLELALSPETGGVELRHAEVVRAGTASAERELQQAKNDIEGGKFSTFASVGDLAEDLRKRRVKEAMEQEGLEACDLIDQFEDLKKRMGLIEAQVVKVKTAGVHSGTGTHEVSSEG